MAKTYFEKLKDPRWQKLRLEIFERDDFTCKKCNSKEKTLHVHHGFYERDKEPWEYDEWSLITLCEECHKSVETMRKAFLARMADKPRWWEVILPISGLRGMPMVSPASQSLATAVSFIGLAADQMEDLMWDESESVKHDAIAALERSIRHIQEAIERLNK